MAGQGGINVAFGRVFPQRPATLRVENLNILDALDLLAIGTGSFWQPMNENTVAVYDGTRENRRDFALQEMEIVYLSEGTTMQRLDDLTNALRTVLGMQGVHSYEPRKALLLRDTSSNILLGEDLIAALEGTPTLSRVVVADLNGGASQVVSLRAAPATRSWLKLRIAALPFKEGGDIRNIYEFIAQSAGISVVFAPKFPARRVEFQFNGLEVIDLLDIVAHQTGTFWQTIDERTILVAEDTQQNRRDYEVQVLKTILLPVRTTPEEMNKLTNILRTALNPRSMYDSATVKAIVLRDTPSTVELMEKIVRQLIPDPTAVVITVPAPGLAEGRFLGNAAVAGSQLELRPTGAISAQVLQDSRVSYETLAELGGIKVSFDPRFNPGFPMTLRLQAMDIPHALDQLSLQTGNYWTVLDRWTIFVAPDTPEVRRQIDPPVSRTVSLKTVAPDAAGEIVTILRTILSMAEVESNGASSIVMRDTPNRIAVAEQMITNLDRP
jgi:hypothetical protein